MPYQDFVPAVDPNATLIEDALCFAFRSGHLLIGQSRTGDSLPLYGELVEIRQCVLRTNFIGSVDAQPVFALEIEDGSPEQSPFSFAPLRAAFGPLDEAAWMIAARAAMVLEWDRNHQYCGSCGNPTIVLDNERAKQCPNCGLVAYPRVSPAVIVLVERGNDVLLARGAHLTTGMYALIAGFVEAGESLEDAVHREIREEVGIEVTDIRYFGSQPWPFPHQLMVGFTAQYASGSIKVEPSELQDAKFFSPDAMPPIPPRLSIARRLIDAYAQKHGVDLDPR